MRGFFTVAALIAAAAQQAAATLYVTAPTASTNCAAGGPCPITWNDDGQSPALSAIGQVSVGLYVGNSQTQFLLQTIATNFDVSQVATLGFTPDASVGQNYGGYFIRFTSNNLKDATNSQYPHQDFSAMFTLTGMTGTFNSTIQQVISSSSTGGAPSSTSGSSTPTNTVVSTTSGSAGSSVTSKVSTVTNKSSATSVSSTHTSTSTPGAAVKIVAGTGSSIAVVASLVIVAVSGIFTAAF